MRSSGLQHGPFVQMMPSSTFVTREIGIEAPEAADLQLFLVVHAAGEEPAAAVALAVVQPRARLVRRPRLRSDRAAPLAKSKK